MKHLKIYDINNNTMILIKVLKHATNKGYNKKLNNIWSANFSLPANDPNVNLCTPFRLVEFFDNDERVDLFRILPSSQSYDENSDIITFECEHVLATLTDDILFQYHEKNNLTTSDVLSYILSKQSIVKWTLGTVDFTYQFSYKWESENLLGSIFSVTEPFIDEYEFTWDTTTFPWILNLVQSNTNIKSWIRYGRNLKNIEKRVDPSNICTRIYGLGYGEGVNQLTISDINNGLPYIDADTIGTYGIISRIYTDTKEENASNLKLKMEANLAQFKIPRIEYGVNAAHLYQITDKSIDNFYLGSYCRAIDQEHNIEFTARVISISKSDIDNNPGDINLEIANSPDDVTKTMSNLSNKQRINEVYAQGATNLVTQDFQDNADSDNPATLKFYIPEECVRINKMELNFKTTKFRAYSKAIQGGGATSTTTGSGGGIISTTGSGGGIQTSTASGGGVASTTAAGGGVSTTSSDAVFGMTAPQPLPADFMNLAGGHSHGLGGVSIVSGGDPAHSHGLSGSTDWAGTHAHSMWSIAHIHSVEIAAHYHSVTIQSHTHDVYVASHSHEINLQEHSHVIQIPNHTHDIQYGIYLYNSLPTAISVSVDGNIIPNLNLNEDKVNIIPYLDVDSDGKITRGTWHEISITPNNLARIEANIITQLFIQSRGGGNY